MKPKQMEVQKLILVLQAKNNFVCEGLSRIFTHISREVSVFLFYIA